MTDIQISHNTIEEVRNNTCENPESSIISLKEDGA
jgi:hypothetical protein